MKKLVIAVVALIAVSSLSFSNAKAADLSASPIQAQAGQVPTDTLAAMGLGGMITLSDADGMHIRGMGTKITIVQIGVVIQGFTYNKTPVLIQTVNFGGGGRR
jgi:hypothetical protein